jgi:hypothetical protein
MHLAFQIPFWWSSTMIWQFFFVPFSLLFFYLGSINSYKGASSELSINAYGVFEQVHPFFEFP